jgi:predicted nucleic acid-binding protein
MILFFDTSALIKRYISEPESKKVDELFESDVKLKKAAGDENIEVIDPTEFE